MSYSLTIRHKVSSIISMHWTQTALTFVLAGFGNSCRMHEMLPWILMKALLHPLNETTTRLVFGIMELRLVWKNSSSHLSWIYENGD